MKGSSAAAGQQISIGTAMGRWGSFIPTADGGAVKQRRDVMFEAGLNNPTTQQALIPVPKAPDAPAAPVPAPAPEVPAAPAAPTADAGSTKKKKKSTAGPAPTDAVGSAPGFKSLLGD